MSSLRDRNLRILNFTQFDMDGAVANIVIRNYYNKVISEPITSSRENDVYKKIVEHRDQFDVVLFTGHCPENIKDIKAFGRPILVLDYHESVLELNDPNSNVFIRPNVGSARFVYESLNTDGCLGYLGELVNITEDDTFQKGVDIRSRQLSALFWNYKFEWFVKRFYRGEVELSESEKTFLMSYQKKFKRFYDNLEIVELRNGGVFCTSRKYLSEITHSLFADGYRWCAVYRPNVPTGSFSVRSSNGSGIDLIKVVKTMCRGGGMKHSIGIAQDKDEIDEMVHKIDDAVDVSLKEESCVKS